MSNAEFQGRGMNDFEKVQEFDDWEADGQFALTLVLIKLLYS
jgi:hypothetical protein